MINENKFALDAWAILIQDAQVGRNEKFPRRNERFRLEGEENRRVARVFRIARRAISDLRQILEDFSRSGSESTERIGSTFFVSSSR